MKNIILASGSPRRKKLLNQVGLSFDVQVSSVDEDFNTNQSPEDIVQELALRKAKDIARNTAEALVIGADTIVVFEDKILEKPAGESEAEQMLRRLSGTVHQVYTGVALVKVDDKHNIIDKRTFFECTNVFFGDLNPNYITEYVQSGSPMDKAGGYGIQDDFGAIFVKRIEGDYYNVVGFPLHSFYNVMETFAPEYIPHEIEPAKNE